MNDSPIIPYPADIFQSRHSSLRAMKLQNASYIVYGTIIASLALFKKTKIFHKAHQPINEVEEW